MCFLPLFLHTAICQLKLAASAIQKRLRKAPARPAILVCVTNHFAVPCARAITRAGWICHRIPRLCSVDRAARALDASAVITDRIPSSNGRTAGPVFGVVPVVMLGPPSLEADALAAGAALFVPLPIDPPGLIQGLSQIIQGFARESRKVEGDPNGLWLDPRTAQARVGDAPLALSPRHFCVLHELARHPGRLLTTERLCTGITGIRPMTPGALAVCVSRLRKLLRSAGAPDCIETVHCFGYRYIIAASPLVPTATTPWLA